MSLDRLKLLTKAFNAIKEDQPRTCFATAEELTAAQQYFSDQYGIDIYDKADAERIFVVLHGCLTDRMPAGAPRSFPVSDAALVDFALKNLSCSDGVVANLAAHAFVVLKDKKPAAIIAQIGRALDRFIERFEDGSFPVGFNGSEEEIESLRKTIHDLQNGALEFEAALTANMTSRSYH